MPWKGGWDVPLSPQVPVLMWEEVTNPKPSCHGVNPGAGASLLNNVDNEIFFIACTIFVDGSFVIY